MLNTEAINKDYHVSLQDGKTFKGQDIDIQYRATKWLEESSGFQVIHIHCMSFCCRMTTSYVRECFHM